ncbi:MAG: glycosyltransferase family 2 protein, partial [Cetobacterium sp.]
MKKEILILMATYNGERYLNEQLDSLFQQTNKDWDLIISDDNSTDKTLKIIQEYSEKYKNIKIINHIPKNGALGNFSNLIKLSKEMNYNYIMFCDQDDVWKEDKIQKTLNFIKSKEQDKPTLVFTDKEYVDEKLNILGYNLGKYNKFDLEILLHQNVIYGCTMMLNNKLLMELLDKIPVEFLNHDHYVAIMGKILGNIYYLDYKSILYRQHGKNVSGNINKTLVEKLKDREIYSKNINLFIFITNFIINNYQEKLNENERKKMLE